jgi:hypothetical protein
MRIPNIWHGDLQTPATTSCYRRAAKTAATPRFRAQLGSPPPTPDLRRRVISLSRMRISTIRPCACRTILVQPLADRKRRQRMRRLCLQPEGTATDDETLPARPPRRAARSRPTKPRRGPPAHHSAVLRPRGPSAARDASRYGKAYLPEDSGTSSDFAQTRPSPDPPPLHRPDLTRTSSTGAAPTAHPLADTRSARRRGPAARRPAGRFRLISGAVYRSVQPGVRTSCDRLEPQGGHTGQGTQARSLPLLLEGVDHSRDALPDLRRQCKALRTACTATQHVRLRAE